MSHRDLPVSYTVTAHHTVLSLGQVWEDRHSEADMKVLSDFPSHTSNEWKYLKCFCDVFWSQFWKYKIHIFLTSKKLSYESVKLSIIDFAFLAKTKQTRKTENICVEDWFSW